MLLVMADPVNPRQQPRAQCFPCVAPARQAEGCTEGPSLASAASACPGAKHADVGHGLGASGDGAGKGTWRAAFTQHVLLGLSGTRWETATASAPSAAGKLSVETDFGSENSYFKAEKPFQ